MSTHIHRLRILYFVLIIGIGGIGCWVSGFQHIVWPTPQSGYSFCDNLATFAISLGIVAFIDHLVVSQDLFDLWRTLVRFAFAFLATIAGIIPLVLKFWPGVASAWLSLILACIAWWLVHLGNKALDPQAKEANSALGGNV